MRLLRRMKAEAALLIALADIGGVWPVMRATRALTELADTAVGAAVRLPAARRRARAASSSRADPAQPEQGCGHIVLAMGKMGAFELNYSSDIDLIVFYDPDAPALADEDEAAAFHVRITRGLVKLLQERTGDGYVFRVDLRLRPDPASTQIAVSIAGGAQLLRQRRPELGARRDDQGARLRRRHRGRRGAPCASSSPFIWRKYLDFAAVADIEAMKRQIHAYRGHEDIAVEGHNIKLGRGGIREIEFFVQTQQLIAGGRHPELRGRETLATLAALAEGGWIDADARADLDGGLSVSCARSSTACRWWPTTRPTRCRRIARARALCALCRLQGSRRVRRDAARPSAQCAAALRQAVRGHGGRRADQATLSFPKEADDRETLDRLGAMGFRKPLEVSATVRRWLSGVLSFAARRVCPHASSPSWCRCCSTGCRAPRIRTRH